MDVDRYGRTVAVCRAGDTDLNRQMVLDGWALAYRQHEHRYVGNEATARANRRGLWQGRFERPGDWRAMYRSDAAAD
jgi:endonuclease YncB( thermonuclease family)